MKKCLVLIMVVMILLTGCWDKRELKELGLALAIALDKEIETDKIIVTLQIVRPSALKEKGGIPKSPVELVSATGNTVFEAIRNITKEFDRRGYFAHTKVLIIDEKIAEEGIVPIVDMFVRTHEVRRLISLIIAKNTTAREILGYSHGLEDIQAVYLENIIKVKGATSEVTTFNLLDFLKTASGKGINPIAGAMEIIEQKNLPSEYTAPLTRSVKLSGTAVFNSDKLIGYLDDKQTKGLNWVIGKVVSGTINVPVIEKEGKWINIEITDADSKIEPKIVEDKYVFTVNVKARGVITEHQGSADVFEPEFFEEVETGFTNLIKQEIKNTINIVQRDFRSDIFGFGSALSKKYPQEWKKIEDEWSNIFPDAMFIINVDAKIKGTGLLKKPFEPSD